MRRVESFIRRIKVYVMVPTSLLGSCIGDMDRGIRYQFLFGCGKRIHPSRVDASSLFSGKNGFHLHNPVDYWDADTEVMKGLKAKKTGKLDYDKFFSPLESAGRRSENSNCEVASTRSSQSGKTHHQV
ncbi:hypothetical protein L2E82_25768 [Cichorium intybus]|uniref:Uncharacterized protein n=1 Tax=Cichorium intybus TaxID=13427 RepID=A0ACB9E4H0_CICIN|nr:hypothetical protein L2E82_25768 [Cichorium intybus]